LTYLHKRVGLIDDIDRCFPKIPELLELGKIRGRRKFCDSLGPFISRPCLDSEHI